LYLRLTFILDKNVCAEGGDGDFGGTGGDGGAGTL